MSRVIVTSVLVVVAWAPVFVEGSVLTFRQGEDSGFGVYVGAADTDLYQGSPDLNRATNTTIGADGYPDKRQAVLRFNDIFGAGAGQIPLGATITSATLALHVTNDGVSRVPARLLWDVDVNTVTYNNAALGGNLTAGLQVDGVDATGPADAFSGAELPLDVTAIVQAWADGAANYGFLLANYGANDNAIIFTSAEGEVVTERPMLTVEYIPEPVALGLLGTAAVLGLMRRRSR